MLAIIEPGTILANRYQIRKQFNPQHARNKFLAQDLHSQDLVVIDLPHREATLAVEDVDLFRRQTLSLSALQHPAIPKYHDAFQIEGSIDCSVSFALVQTYINAPSLDTVIQAGRKFSELELIELADRLLAILIYLHDCDPAVIHRNLSPNSILLVDRDDRSIGDIYLVDFELSPTKHRKSLGACFAGHHTYASSDKFGNTDAATIDLYSLGMTLVYLATGQHPWEFLNSDRLDPETYAYRCDDLPVGIKFSSWISSTSYFLSPHSQLQRFWSAQLARVALNAQDGPISSASTSVLLPSPPHTLVGSIPLPDTAPGSTLLPARDISRSPASLLWVKLIGIVAVVTLGCLAVAKVVQKPASYQNQPPINTSD
jgi:serine/threonine protein kinase